MLEFPDVDEAMAALAPLFPTLYQAFEAGTARARAFFEAEAEREDPHLFAASARHGALAVIDRQAGVGGGLQRVPLTNCGIQLAYAGYDLRCWKTTDGELPGPSTQAKRQFVGQLLLGAPFPESSAAGNLVVQWEHDPATGRVDLMLVCPKPGRHGTASVEIHWSRPIPHPAEDVRLNVAPADAPNPVEDLDFIRPAAAQSAGRAS